VRNLKSLNSNSSAVQQR